jgi:hypothetical protein
VALYEYGTPRWHGDETGGPDVEDELALENAERLGVAVDVRAGHAFAAARG